MPVWPSLEPCVKLTPVQVAIRMPRIQNGGGLLPIGAAYSAGLRTQNVSEASRVKALRLPACRPINSAEAGKVLIEHDSHSPAGRRPSRRDSTSRVPRRQIHLDSHRRSAPPHHIRLVICKVLRRRNSQIHSGRQPIPGSSNAAGPPPVLRR